MVFSVDPIIISPQGQIDKICYCHGCMVFKEYQVNNSFVGMERSGDHDDATCKRGDRKTDRELA